MQQSTNRALSADTLEAGQHRRRSRLPVGGLVAVLIAFVTALAVSPEPAAGAQETGGWTQEGKISWYGPGFHGRLTANGEVFDKNELTMAHNKLPFGSRVRVTNLNNGRSVIVRVNDRGPFVAGRVGDLSRAAAEEIGMVDHGVVVARLEVLEDDRRSG